MISCDCRGVQAAIWRWWQVPEEHAALAGTEVLLVSEQCHMWLCEARGQELGTMLVSVSVLNSEIWVLGSGFWLLARVLTRTFVCACI